MDVIIGRRADGDFVLGFYLTEDFDFLAGLDFNGGFVGKETLLSGFSEVVDDGDGLILIINSNR